MNTLQLKPSYLGISLQMQVNYPRLSSTSTVIYKLKVTTIIYKLKVTTIIYKLKVTH